MVDPLAQFRKKPALIAENPEPPTGGEEYFAFHAKDKNERLKIRRSNAPTRSPLYAYLIDISYDSKYGDNFVLVYTFYMVLVRGKYLQSVVAAIEMGTAEYIQEFDPDVWTKPTDSKAPFIQSIEVVVDKNGPVILESEKIGKRVH